LEIGWYAEPKGTGAKPHHHPSEQIIMVLSGKLRMRVGDEVRDLGPNEVALILGDQEHEQMALEEGTRFVSFKRSVGTQPEGE
jgi:quercetin dioxygenase-like cupin family protein